MRFKIFLAMTVLLLISSGVTTYLLFFNEEEYTATKTVEQTNSTVKYTEAIVKEFKRINELYFYEGKLEFEAKMESDDISKSEVINDLFYKKTSVKAVGNLKAGIDFSELTIDESDKEIVVNFEKDQIIKLFIADKVKSKIKSESGWFSRDYDAEEMSAFWAEIESEGTEEELSDKQTEEITEQISEGIKDVVKAISGDNKKIKVEMTI